MFGALLGTLQRFRTDEVKQKEKVRTWAASRCQLEHVGRVSPDKSEML